MYAQRKGLAVALLYFEYALIFIVYALRRWAVQGSRWHWAAVKDQSWFVQVEDSDTGTTACRDKDATPWSPATFYLTDLDQTLDVRQARNRLNVRCFRLQK